MGYIVGMIILAVVVLVIFGAGVLAYKYGKSDECSHHLWGDAPADAMGDGIEEAILRFHKDVGRLPTELEVREGFKFSLDTAFEMAKEKIDGDEN